MRKLIFIGVFLSLINPVLAQDTTWVQTFTYDSISTRRATFSFPASLEDKRFEKVLMYYNIKCDPLTPWDSYNCGEWDYLAYSHVYDHTGELDSNKVSHARYLLNNVATSPIEYVLNAYYHYWEYYQKYPIYSVDTDVDAVLGLGTSPINYPLGTAGERQKTQILFLNSELLLSGITAGEIAKLRLDLSTIGDDADHLTIRIKHTSETELTGFEIGGFTEVYKKTTNFSTSGLNTFEFYTPFIFDGSSNILLEIEWDNNGTTAVNNKVNATNTVFNSVVYSSDNHGLLNVTSANYAELELGNYDFGNEISICFWAKGDEDFLPANTSVLEGKDSLGNRIVNIHFPWSNSRHYWDVGTGSGYDRIDKDASLSEFEGEWHHWAFTKNASTGQMNIFKDGVLWLNGTGKTLPIGVVNQFRIGNSVSGNYQWAGLMDEFSIWDVTLSSSEILTYLNKKIDASHPDFSNLVAYYDFDNVPNISDKSGNGIDGMMTEPGMIVSDDQIFAGYELTTLRPNITFVQGVHTFTLDSALVIDSAVVAPIDIAEYAVNGQKFDIIDIFHVYPEGYSYTFDFLGNKLDSVFYAAEVSLANDTLIYYNNPFEIINEYEIGRYITPYGIGFDLGPNGFTYVYDISDYQSLLNGDVDFSAHNTQELIDIKFAFIEGIPPRDVLSVDQLWGERASYTYANLDNDVNLSEINVDLAPEGAMYKVRSRITGHGHNGSVNCCEWGAGEGRDHYLLVDGVERYAWEIWQETECGDNPNTAQGGTWPYAREGWCPGDIVEDHEFEITDFVVPGTNVALDYDIEDVPVSDPAQGNGNYVISMHMITYGNPNFQVDAAIQDVLNPNNWEYYGKWNPTCQNPRVILKNTGAENLTSARISIWVGGYGDNVIIYDWSGNLAFLEEEIVEIPVTDDWWYDWEGELTFHAEVFEANGGPDEYAQNNIFSTAFEATPNIQIPFYIWLKTNNKASENQIYLKNSDGTTIYSRTSMTNLTEYKDTFDLDPGCYTLELYDSDHDGLGFWYSNIPVSSGGEGETYGFLRLREVGGSMIKVFDTDFGHYVSYSFSVGYALGLEELNLENRMEVYPNPSAGNYYITLDNFSGEEVRFEVYNEMGQLVKMETTATLNPEGYLQYELDMSDVFNGIYILKATSGSGTCTTRIVKQ